MRTALDTNIISAVWSGEENAMMIAVQLEMLKQTDFLVIAPIVYAELLTHPRITELFVKDFISDTQIEIEYDLHQSVWLEAGRRYSRYAARRRKAIQEAPRRLLADFLVGAHTLIHADRLMTFDINRFAQDFPELPLINAAIQ